MGDATGLVVAHLLNLREQVGPALVLCGELDVITPPASAHAMADAIPDARVEIIEGVGHMTPMEAPDAVTGALRSFLVERVRSS